MAVLLERGDVCEGVMFLWQGVFLLLVYQMAQGSGRFFFNKRDTPLSSQDIVLSAQQEAPLVT